MKLSPKQTARFWSSVDTSGDCWMWTGRVDRHGYGAFWANGRSLLAHRQAFELLAGDIPDGLVLDHLCRNRACVRLAHLEPVTLAENIRRGLHAERETTHCKNGHEFTDENTYTYRGKRNCRTCRRETMRRLRSR